MLRMVSTEPCTPLPASKAPLSKKNFGRSLPRYNPTRYRDRLSTEYLKELNAWMRQHGRKAIEKVGKTQPAALLKIIALTLPKEHKVEHSRRVSELSDEQLNDMIDVLSARIEARAQGIDVPPLIEITPDGEVRALPAPDQPAKQPRKRPNPILDYQSIMDQPGYKGRSRRKPKR